MRLIIVSSFALVITLLATSCGQGSKTQLAGADLVTANKLREFTIVNYDMASHLNSKAAGHSYARIFVADSSGKIYTAGLLDTRYDHYRNPDSLATLIGQKCWTFGKVPSWGWEEIIRFE